MPTKTGELVSQAAKGDKNAIAELYTTNFKSAYFPACGLLGNKQDALKAVIGSFAKAFRNLSKLQKPDEFEDWIKQITVKNCIEIIRKKKGVPLSAERPEICRNEIDSVYEFLPIDVLNSKELTSEVMKTINSMPDTQRICVYLTYYNGFSAPATAGIVACSDDEVRWHLLAAREQIKNVVDAKVGKRTELSRMNGTSILSLVMDLMRKEFSVSSDIVKKSFFVMCEKAGLAGEKPQTAAAPQPQYVQAPPLPPQQNQFAQQPPMPPQQNQFAQQRPPMPPQQNQFVQQRPPMPPQQNQFAQQRPPMPPQQGQFAQQLPMPPQQPPVAQQSAPQQEKKLSSAIIVVPIVLMVLIIAAGLIYWFILRELSEFSALINNITTIIDFIKSGDIGSVFDLLLAGELSQITELAGIDEEMIIGSLMP